MEPSLFQAESYILRLGNDELKWKPEVFIALAAQVRDCPGELPRQPRWRVFDHSTPHVTLKNQLTDDPGILLAYQRSDAASVPRQPLLQLSSHPSMHLRAHVASLLIFSDSMHPSKAS